MRSALAVAITLSLAACSSDVPSPAERLEQGEQAAELVEDRVVLRGDGLAAGPEAFYFAAGRSEVEIALARVLGEPTTRDSNGECGAGPMDFTHFAGGLTVNFQDGYLVGWHLEEASEAIATGEARIGMARETLAALPGYAPIADSTLGEEFALGERLGGFLDEGRVSGLYAGTNCFFR